MATIAVVTLLAGNALSMMSTEEKRVVVVNVYNSTNKRLTRDSMFSFWNGGRAEVEEAPAVIEPEEHGMFKISAGKSGLNLFVGAYINAKVTFRYKTDDGEDFYLGLFNEDWKN